MKNKLDVCFPVTSPPNIFLNAETEAKQNKQKKAFELCEESFIHPLAVHCLLHSRAHPPTETQHSLKITNCLWNMWFGRSEHTSQHVLYLCFPFYDQALLDFHVWKILNEEFSQFSTDLGFLTCVLVNGIMVARVCRNVWSVKGWDSFTERLKESILCSRIVFHWEVSAFPIISYTLTTAVGGE